MDCIAYDLEDSVTEGKKLEARANVFNFLRETRAVGGVREVAVRINSTGSGLAEDDLTTVVNYFYDLHCQWLTSLSLNCPILIPSSFLK